MYNTRQCRRIKRLLFPFVSFVIIIILIYRKIESDELHKSSRLHQSQSPTTEKFIPSPTPPIRGWVIVHVTQDYCLHLASTFSEWTILQYGDIQPPEIGARHTRCHYLTGDHQSAVYLYAIQRGAEAIYIHSSPDRFNDITYPQGIHLHDYIDGLTASSDSTQFNTLQHWGCNQSGVHSPIVNHSYRLCKQIKPAIQAQALYHKGQGTNDLDINLQRSCDVSSANVVLQEGTFSYLQGENTFFMKDAFWSLPVIKTDGVEDICFTFVIQKVLWLTGKHLLLRSGNVIPVKQYGQDKHLIRCKTLLLHQECYSMDLKTCITKILKEIPPDLISGETVETIVNWLDVLRENKYKFPEIVRNVDFKCEPEYLWYAPVDHNVTYSVKKWRPNPFPPINNVEKIKAVHDQTCQGMDVTTGVKLDFLAPWLIWEDVLLIIVFNNPLYSVIPYTEVLYRSFFPHMLYCGPGLPDTDKFPNLQDYNITFVSYVATPAGHFPGAFSYKCLMMAVQMQYNVHGYLVIADDLLLVPNRIKHFNLQKGWYIPPNEVKMADIKTLRECRLGMCDFGTRWRWWEDYQDATIRSFHDLKLKQNESILIQNCYRTLRARNHGDFHPNGAYSDIYYVPKHFAQDFVDLASIFLKHYVFLEITVPTVFQCLIPENEMESLQGKQIWDTSRDSSWVYFTKQDLVYKSYLHPAKWSNLDGGSKEYAQFFCSAVSYLHDPYGRMNKIQ